MLDKEWKIELYNDMVEFYINNNDETDDEFSKFVCLNIFLSTPIDELKEMYCKKNNITLEDMNNTIDNDNELNNI